MNSVGISNITDALVAAFMTVISTLIGFLPQLIAALIVMTFGFLISRWLRTGVIGFMQAVNIETIAKGSKFEKLLQQTTMTHKVEEFVGDVFYWLVMIVFFITAINILGLTTVSSFLTGLLAYLPRLASAIIIFVIGVLAAGLVENLVKGMVVKVNAVTARMVAKIASYTIVVFAGLIALSEIGIAKNFIQILFVGIVAMLSIGVGLAVGLGAKDLVKQILEEWYTTARKSSGKK